MKNSPSVKICKKKRKSERRLNRIFQRALTDCNQLKNALQPARNLRLRNSSPIKQTLHRCRYHFKLTRAVKRNISKIKRTIINETISPVQSTNRISISDRITSQISTTGCKSFSLPGNFVCSPKFLEHRSLKMAKIPNKSSESIQTFPNIIITFEEMLNIRKKRLDKKHQRSCTKTSESNDSVVEIVDEADTTVNCNIDKHEFCEMVVEEKNQDIIEIGDDSTGVINCENNNIEKNCDIKYYNILDHTEKNDQYVEIRKTEVATLTSEISNNMEETKQNEYAEVLVNLVEKNHNIIDIDVLTIDDSIVNTMPELPSAIKIMETPEKVTSANDINNQSIVIITPNRNDLPKTKPIDKKLKRSRWSSNSVITISDTPGLSQDISDNDIIFVSQSTTSSSPKKRRLDRKPSVVIIDDDDSKRTVACHSVQRPRKKKGKKRTKRKKNVTVFTTSTSTSELASCADTNCINTPNRNPGLGRKAHPTCACLQSKDACALTPNLLKIPEESATAAQSHRDKHESTEMRVHHSGTVNDKFGSNIHNAGHVVREGLRMIIIDGSNVALGHSNGAVFSVKGLQIAIDYFLKKGHVVKAFVPQYRVKRGQCTNPFLLQHLAAKRLVILTPSREVKGRRITPYDDRYVIQYATAFEGIVVSNDNFRDILAEHPEWRHTIEKRLLMYTWIDDVLIFPEDPLGRHGPNLSRFLRFP